MDVLVTAMMMTTVVPQRNGALRPSGLLPESIKVAEKTDCNNLKEATRCTVRPGMGNDAIVG